jgi:ribosomal protein S18 acetylase RimI-like enzyme
MDNKTSFRPFEPVRLPQLMAWFPDRATLRKWGGPSFRFPHTVETFREDVRLDTSPAWEIVSDDGVLLAFGRYYLRLNRCHLAHLAVAPSMRGRGLGRRLVEELCADGAGHLSFDEYSLFVWHDNEVALRLYRSLGFVEVPYPEPSPELTGMAYMVRPADGAHLSV